MRCKLCCTSYIPVVSYSLFTAIRYFDNLPALDILLALDIPRAFDSLPVFDILLAFHKIDHLAYLPCFQHHPRLGHCSYSRHCRFIEGEPGSTVNLAPLPRPTVSSSSKSSSATLLVMATSFHLVHMASTTTPGQKTKFTDLPPEWQIGVTEYVIRGYPRQSGQ
jgi:hypothetical protein